MSCIIGNSRAVQGLRALIEVAAPSHLPVLIQGPTGAGKELVAAALHSASGRAGRFVAFNVCAIGDSMFEDALFGHVRGAFTGALSDSPGLLREADRGTVFFDEISGLHAPLQAKLLRAIELQEFRPVGANRDVRSAFRFIAATNEPIDRLVDAGRFRSDLAHRIGAVVIHVPPLVHRREDIRELALHFLSRDNTVGASIDDDAVRVLQHHTWPGNIRELKQVVEWACVLGGGRVSARVVELALSQRVVTERAVERVSDDAREYVELRALLDAHRWDTESAARALGVHRATLYRRMKRNQLVAPFNARGVDAASAAVIGG
ncbi:MAG: sigma 54-interacting transcriptional regulator [bacterium]